MYHFVEFYAEFPKLKKTKRLIKPAGKEIRVV